MILEMTRTLDGESKISPTYKALSEFDSIGAVYTGKGVSACNSYFSFHRPSSSAVDSSKDFISNINYLAHKEGFNTSRVTWPNGTWPHSGQAIQAEDYTWITDTKTGGLIPISNDNQPVTYDGIATRSPTYVLGIQGADCPMIFLYDPASRVIGAVHAGWRPVVRNVIKNTINAMGQLGAAPHDIRAYISPGAGDTYNEFHWDDKMESHVKAVFTEAGRQDLLEDKRIRHDMTDKDLLDLAFALGREVHDGISFKLSTLAAIELETCGVFARNISCSHDSSIVACYPVAEGIKAATFRYHSYRRERPNHGLSMGVIFLKPKSH